MPKALKPQMLSLSRIFGFPRGGLQPHPFLSGCEGSGALPYQVFAQIVKIIANAAFDCTNDVVDILRRRQQ